MKKYSTLLLAFGFTLGCVIFSCDKKKSEGITPTYGSTGNPNPSNITVTGSTTYSNPATDNTSINVGGSGWTNPSCGSTNSLSLKGYNGDTDVTLSFSGAPKTGTYSIAESPSANSCAMTIVNAPGQPAGIVWIGKSGSVSVQTSSTTINASFTEIICTQKTFNFPVVSAKGVLGCTSN